MAEIAIPLLALGGLYIASNKNDKSKGLMTREGFNNNNNINSNMQYSYPTINQEPVINYPTTQDVKNSNIRKYPNANQSTDKYFSEKTYENIGMKYSGHTHEFNKQIQELNNKIIELQNKELLYIKDIENLMLLHQKDNKIYEYQLKSKDLEIDNLKKEIKILNLEIQLNKK